MDTPQDLLEAICKQPDDDALRERYAMMIEPSDKDHAELIRLQLARAKQERAAGVVRSDPTGREGSLLDKNAGRWSRYMAKLLVPDGQMPGDLGCTFDRGFIAHVRIALENVLGLGGRLYMFAPIQHLDVAPGEGNVRRVFGVAGLKHLDSISLRGLGLGDAEAKALADCEALSRATWMDLSANEIDVPGVVALAGSAMMQNKVVVELVSNPCDPVEQPYFDYDGSLLDVSAKFPPKTIETRVGHPVPWLHYRWNRTQPQPDRFHTRYAAK
jgi:uncharacterized protein (TIGR02996 family)